MSPLTGWPAGPREADGADRAARGGRQRRGRAASLAAWGPGAKWRRARGLGPDPGLRRLLLLCALGIGGCQAALLEDQAEGAANDVIAALSRAGIEAEKRRTGRRFEVRVARGALPEAWLALRAAGLPEAPAASQPAGLVLTPTQAQAEVHRARERDLERLLEGRPDVARARVALSAQGAAVVLRHPAGEAPPPPQIEALIRQGAGLGPAATVTLDLHPLPPPQALATPVDPPQDPPAAAPAPAGGPLLGALAGLGGLCLVLLWRLRRPGPRSAT